MEQKGTTFVDFLIQLIVIILFVILLVWLFPTKDWLKENYFGNTYIEEKETTIDDEKFVTNINNMLEASKNYFGYNVNLPENIDDTVKVTLKELVDNHIMIMPKDSKGKKCDSNSYATITKTEIGYTIKVDLTCGGYNDYITRVVGCDPFCQNNCTQKCTLEYQYSKKVDGYFTSWSVWSAWQTNKKTPTEYLKVEEKEVTTKVCPSGYTLNANQTSCVKTVKNETTVDSIINKSCPQGYEFNNDKTLCIRKTNSIIEVEPTINYSCNSGYTLTKDNKCVKTSTTNKEIDATYTYLCPSGYTLNGTKCFKTETISSNVTNKKTCMSGYTYIGSNKCQKISILKTLGSTTKGAECSISYEIDCKDGCKTVAKETCIIQAGTNYNYSCPQGYELTSDKQKCVSTTTIDAEKSYNCKEGTLNGKKCIITTTNTETINSNINYTCSNGTLKNNKCIIDNTKEETKEVIITYTCSNGTLKDNKCVLVNEKEESTKYTLKKVTMYRYSTRTYVKETISYKWSTSKEDSKLIKSGYSLTGKTRKNCK